MSVFFCLVFSCVVCFAMGQVYVYRILAAGNTIRIDHHDFSFTAEKDDEGEGNCEEVVANCVCVWRGYGLGVSFLCLHTRFSPISLHEKTFG